MLRVLRVLGVLMVLGVTALCVACAERHDARGLVLAVDLDRGRLTVSHEPIPGFMDAMVMPFDARRPEEMAEIRPGDRIAFRLTTGDRTLIDRIRVLSAALPDAAAAAARPPVAIGTAVPDFTLTNQHGQQVSLASLHGKTLVVSFIYSRCPLPDYCPRVMTNLGAVRDRLGPRLGPEAAILTVTFDPQHDTPQKLKEYADRYGANVAGWHLLTGTRDEIEKVCAAFGLQFWPEEGMITHNLQTAVVDREGKLAALAEGRDYSARQLSDLVDSQLQTPNSKPQSRPD